MRSKDQFFGRRERPLSTGSTVLGWYGRGNAGDDAFVEALQIFLGNSNLKFVSPDQLDKNLDKNEIIFVGAGDICKGFFLDEVAHHKNVVIVGAGLGYESEVELLKKVEPKLLWMRNRKDVDICRKHGLNAYYTPDICFGLPKLARSELTTATDSRKKLGIILSGHAVSGVDQDDPGESSYLEYFQWELAKSLNYLEEFYQIYWISMSSDPDAWDESIHYSVRKKMHKRKNQIFCSYKKDHPDEVRRIISHMDVVVSMKFHGCVFSIMNDVPVLSIGFSRKNEILMKEAGLEDLSISPFSFQKDRFIRYIENAERPQTIENVKRVSKEYVENVDLARIEVDNLIRSFV